MSDILCIYYSRTGNTKKAMEEIGIAENRRIGGLGSAQKEKLIERFGK